MILLGKMIQKPGKTNEFQEFSHLKFMATKEKTFQKPTILKEHWISEKPRVWIAGISGKLFYKKQPQKKRKMLKQLKFSKKNNKFQ